MKKKHGFFTQKWKVKDYAKEELNDIKDKKMLYKVILSKKNLEATKRCDEEEEQIPVGVITNPWYRYSTEYRMLLGVSDGENISDAIDDMLNILEDGLLCEYAKCIVGYWNARETPMSSFAHARTQQKCAYLSCALQMALGKYPCANGLGKWADCCEEAITALKYMPSGISPPKSERIILNWFVDFRQNGRRLVVPSVSMANNMKDHGKLPHLLHVYPDLKNVIVEFADANIGDITVDVMHSYMNKCIGIVVENEALFRTPIDLTGGEESSMVREESSTSSSDNDNDNENEKDKEDDGDNLKSNLPNLSEDLQKQFQHAAVEHSPRSISIALPSLKQPSSSDTTPRGKDL
eukprot:scaffold18000_cov44-Attheya_sp.AAC.3